MLTGELRNQIDRIWDAFWAGGISNPLEVIEQITYLLFLRRLDDLQTLAENRAATLHRPIERRVFPRKALTPKRGPTTTSAGRASSISRPQTCMLSSTTTSFRSCVRSAA